MNSYRFTIRGVVQGVGFRPFVYVACKKSGLVGYVQNIGSGVIVEVNDKKKFLQILKDVPPLARIDTIQEEEMKNSFADFSIRESRGEGHAEIPADLFLCEDCLQELRNPKNRRFGYFFITCTNCGPRFTITKQSPYDRDTTTMGDFAMCSQCQEEYENPSNRRYHAQTIACHDCGPKLKLKKNNEVLSKNDKDAIYKTAELIQKGEVVAIKGVGGYHLACSLQSEAVQKLKKLTGRTDKPFSIMCRDLNMAQAIAEISNKEAEMLQSSMRPIVILKKKKDLKEVTELDTVGAMLPYTALHYLLFDHLDEPIIMTSANLSGEPIRTENVSDITSYSLEHNRNIENPADDSLIKVILGQTLFIRRSRGCVPQSIELKNLSSKTVLALGAEMNSSFCLWNNNRAILSQYLGNTSNVKTFENYKKMLEKFLEFTHVKPGGILADMHPGYNTALYAEELSKKWDIPLIRVQHHKAHAYGVAAEYGFDDFSAIVCDGLGYGEDRNIWGGEVFYNNHRVGHLENQLQLGGDSATKHPAKMAFSILRKFMNVKEVGIYLDEYFSEKELNILDKQYRERFNTPLTSSCGRVLDAVSALLGVCHEKTYDGRPAMFLEAKSSKPYDLNPVIEDTILMTTPLFEFLVRNREKDKNRLAATAQYYLAQGMYEIATQYSDNIVFSGGCAYNRIMTEYLLSQGVKINKNIPAGDGGIAFGQVAYYLAQEKKAFQDVVSRITRES